MKVTIKPSKLNGTVKVVSSKSLSHRYVIAAGLAKGTSVVSNVLDSNDLSATKKALEGLNVTFEDEKVISSGYKLISDTVDCIESGSTLRFMIPIYMLQKEKVIFKGSGGLIDRPLNVYENIFTDKGLGFHHLEKDHYLPLEIEGKLEGGHYKVRGDISSQFVSGLLFALPLAKKDSIIEITTPLSSKGYVDMTLDTLTKFGIQYEYVDNRIFIPGKQKYEPRVLDVEGDFSQGAFWMVAGTINQHKLPLFLRNLDPLSKQGDRKIADIISKMGGYIYFQKDLKQFVVYPRQTKGGLIIDIDPIPDLGPILMVLAALSEGETHFINCHRLKIKESDRLNAMYEVLTKFGVEMKITDDEAWITGQTSLKGNLEFSSYNDHRIAMAIAIASLRADGDVTITDSQAVEKSYPNFFEVFKELGGLVDEID
ncbi:3-phosphoshikimate 1-carboxyvinyltransferase [Mariniplasma anaerobium]|uniref:3-phosphoshikimate 1-carboxyvinyltransferase n=1 Tax=Mariniplasma anaerobium TaxID=2735436 RepID=A0A7U9TIU0_9MOLU|nr:3-phosphoshikimate 1-carboxyvinyltransferase [Mariniplasma anaerobium]BCR35480.1 3-phosphoshikimate 1-carboxyvinyltransferase [Mariniplasma anaerobium]